MIRIRPEVGNHLIINQAFIEPNAFFLRYMTDLKVNAVYEILAIADVDSEWGITSVKDVETGVVTTITDHPELDDYWCIFDTYDSVRLVDL